MPTSKRVWNEKVYQRYLAEGRGGGEYASYLPWIKVSEAEKISERVWPPVSRVLFSASRLKLRAKFQFAQTKSVAKYNFV